MASVVLILVQVILFSIWNDQDSIIGHVHRDVSKQGQTNKSKVKHRLTNHERERAGVIVPARGQASRATSCAAFAARLGGRRPAVNHPRVTVVWGTTFAGYPNEFGLVYQQLESLLLVGLMDADVDIHLVLAFGNARVVSEKETRATTDDGLSHSLPGLTKLVNQIRIWASHVHIYMKLGNTFEYPAFHLLWSQARVHPDRVYLYFHSKGQSHPKFKGTNRMLTEMALFREVVAPWRSVLDIFDLWGPAVQHLGIMTCLLGYEWYNFFWARGDFLARLHEPERVERRGYYEEWLGRLKPPRDCPAELDLGGLSQCALGCNYSFSLLSCRPNACANVAEVIANLTVIEQSLQIELEEFLSAGD